MLECADLGQASSPLAEIHNCRVESLHARPATTREMCVVDPKRPVGGGSPADITGRFASTTRRRTVRAGYRTLRQLRERGSPHEHEGVQLVHPPIERQLFLRTVSQHIRESVAAAPSQPLSAGSVLRGLEEVLVDIGSRLTDLVGTGGYRALVARALRLAAVEFHVLADVEVAESPPGRLMVQGNLEMHAVHSDRLLEAASAVFTHLVGLLEEFLGGELAARLLRESLPRPSGGRAC